MTDSVRRCTSKHLSAPALNCLRITAVMALESIKSFWDAGRSWLIGAGGQTVEHFFVRPEGVPAEKNDKRRIGLLNAVAQSHTIGVCAPEHLAAEIYDHRWRDLNRQSPSQHDARLGLSIRASMARRPLIVAYVWRLDVVCAVRSRCGWGA